LLLGGELLGALSMAMRRGPATPLAELTAPLGDLHAGLRTSARQWYVEVLPWWIQ
jgi:hypothetical protein